MKKYLSLAVCAAALATSCYPDESIDAPLHEPDYRLEDSSDPIDHKLYLINRNTGVFVLYDYADREFMWNMESLSSNTLARQEDRAVLSTAMTYMDRVLMDHYSDEFKKKYFPFKILLAAQISNANYSLPDRASSSGRGYLALGKLREGAMPSTAEQLAEARGDVNGELWGYIIYQNGLAAIPDNFFETSADWYGVDMKGEAGRDLPATLHNNGFWRYNELDGASEKYRFPDHAADVSDFVRMITSHTAAEMTTLMASYPKLRLKYALITEAVKAATGVDLQAIGDTAAQPID